MKIGCHVSGAGGLEKAPGRAKELGCETFQMFTRSPQGGKPAPITDETAEKFKAAMKENGMTDFVVHAPYFVNFGSTASNVYYGSIAVITDELERCNKLGAKYLMTHLGTYKDHVDENGLPSEEGQKRVADALVKILEKYKGKETKFLLEVAAGSGATIGSSFEQLAPLVDALKKFKTFGGICFDTQHLYASGYDIASAAGIKKVIAKFDKLIGLEYLKMSHINDSKIELGGKKDRHEHIAEGKIGEAGFTEFMKFWKKQDKLLKDDAPFILETEHDHVVEDIETLKRLRKEIK
jgi:deoxyribonuclease-4